MNPADYYSILSNAKKARVCKSYHNCARFNHTMTEWFGRGTKEHRYHVDTPDVFVSSNSLQECENFVRQEGGKIVDNYHCKVCSDYESRKSATSQGIQPSFLIVAYGISRHYDRSGEWFDATEVLEVRTAHAFQHGLKQARELREKFPKPRFDRYSAANRGEPDIYIRCVYSESDQRMPKPSSL